MTRPKVDQRPVSDRRPLVDVVASVREAEREAKRDRARAMDALITLLFERAEARTLLVEAANQIRLLYHPEAPTARKITEYLERTG